MAEHQITTRRKIDLD